MKRKRKLIQEIFGRLREESKSQILGMAEALTFIQRRDQKSRSHHAMKENA